jgi:hypothetical protein
LKEVLVVLKEVLAILKEVLAVGQLHLKMHLQLPHLCQVCGKVIPVDRAFATTFLTI